MFGVGLYICMLLAAVSAIRRRDPLVVPVNKTDEVYIGTISLGEPPQDFNILFDTASADFWVASTQCESDICEDHNLFNANESSTYRDRHKKLTLKYHSTGEVIVGDNGTDTLEIGGINFTNQAFAAVSQPMKHFHSAPFDGIMGLRYQRRGIDYPVLPLYNLHRRGLIPRLWVSFYLYRANNSGQLLLGGSKLLHRNEELIWLRFTSLARGFTVNLFLNQVRYTALLDSSSNKIYGPKDAVDKMYAVLGDAKPNGDVNCSAVSNPPDIIFNLNGEKFPMKPEYYLYKEEGPDGQEHCNVLIIGVKDYKRWILGTPFHEAFPIIYDLEKKNLGIVRPEKR